MNIFKTYSLFIFLPILLCIYSCGGKEILNSRDITLSTQNRYISTAKGIAIYTDMYFTQPDQSDTLKFKLTNEDWNILRESFDKNEIYLINNHSKIGEKSNSLAPSQMVNIRTNKRLLSVEYQYFIGEKDIIDTKKTEKFKSFMRTFDSLIHSRIEKK